MKSLSILLAFQIGLVESRAGDTAYFELRFIDQESKRGIPLVELETVHHVRYVTDNAGRIAYREPGHAGETIFFKIHAPGYDVPKDGFGNAGVRLKIEPGGSKTIPLERNNLAERLYRVTGQDLYRDSVLLGKKTPLNDPLGSGKVSGQDSVLTVPYRDKLYWFWGDTNRLSYPLGLFRTAGATSKLPKDGGLHQSLGVDLNYFTGDNRFARAMVDVKNPKGVVWLDGVTTVKDADGKTKLVCRFTRRPGLAKAFEQGMMVYNDEWEIFEVATNIPVEDNWRHLRNHPIRIQDDSQDYLVSGIPLPVTRVPAKLSAVLDREAYESWSCFSANADLKTAKPLRDSAGKLDWKWRKGPPVTPKIERRWLKDGLIKSEEARYSPVDANQPDRRILLHTGSVFWNAYRKKYILIAIEQNFDRDAPSLLGEVWYSEAESPQGPFQKAIKILTHDKQSFYNPCQHPYFDEAGGRVIYFEGTYCNTFTNSPPTPRYNYNQIMYRLDLSRPEIDKNFTNHPASEAE